MDDMIYEQLVSFSCFHFIVFRVYSVVFIRFYPFLVLNRVLND